MNLDSPALRVSLAREILRVKDSLERTSLGLICRLPGDLCLVHGRPESAFRFIQGQWLDFPLQNVPLEYLLAAFKVAIRKRQDMTESRIAHLTENLDRLESLQESASLANLDRLADLLRELEENRRRD